MNEAMAVVGRILQAIGWVWLALGFFGPFLNLPIDLNIFPGIILIFISRLFRTQAARRGPQESEEQAPTEEQVQPRILNTERSQTVPAPTSRPQTEPARSEVKEPKPEVKRQEMVEQILMAGTDLATGPPSPESDTPAGEEAPVPSRPLSSAEMIAEAHKRWNKR